MRNPLRIPATLLAVAAAAPLAAADWIRVEPAIGLSSLGGHVAYADNGQGGTQVDVGDLDLDGRKASPAIEVDISPPLLPIGFNLGGYRFASDGSARLGQNVDFGGNTYAAGTTVDSDVSLRDLYAEINLQPVRFGIGGASLGVAVHQLAAAVSVSGSGQSAEASRNVWYPAVSARAYVSPIDALQIEAAVQLFRLNFNGNQTGYVDAKAQLGWFPLPVHYLGFFLGYRYISYDLDVKVGSGRLDAKLALTGPYLGAEARF